LELLFDLIIVADLMNKKRGRLYGPAIVWAAIIMAASSIPNLSTTSFKLSYADKIVHFVEYFILGLLTANAVAGFIGRTGKIFWVSAILASVYGVLDELHQKFIPGRSVEVLDMVSNILGAVAASLIFVRFIRKPPSSTV
jgi:VanZ family protein